MSTKTNPQTDAALDDLTSLICESIQGDDSQYAKRKDGLLKTLVMNGYACGNEQSLITEIEARVKSRCGDDAMHRGGELSSFSAKLKKEFESVAKSETQCPSKNHPPKAANMSAATDA